MAMFSKRDNGYKVGMFLFCVGVAGFVTGFATTHWAKFEFRVKALSSSSSSSSTSSSSASSGGPQQDWEVEGHTGLWRYCFKSAALANRDSTCQEVSSSSPDWLTGVKVVESTAVGVMGVALCFFVFTNCVARKAAFTRLLEIGTGLSGLLGAIGAGVYVWKSYTEDEVRESLEATHDFDMSLAWSFYINAGGTAVILLATVLIAVYNIPLNPKRAGTAAVTHRLATPTAPPSDPRGMATTVAHACRPSGTNPYVISAAMTSSAANAPKLYPSLHDDIHEACE